MNNSILNKCLISVSLICNAPVFATEIHEAQDTTTSQVRSFLPTPIHPLNPEEIKKLKAEMKKIQAQKRSFSKEANFSLGGGYGGNEKTGPLYYDGVANHLSALTVRRDDSNGTCYLDSPSATVYQYQYWFFLRMVSYPCSLKDPYHNDVYWNDTLDKLNGSYSPANDAQYAGIMVNSMYLTWFGIPAIKDQKGIRDSIKMVVHLSDEANAYTNEGMVMLADGDEDFYPFTSPGLVSFVVAFLFTDQHANLRYSGQPGAISHAFGSMADQAIKYFITGKNDWENGRELSKIDRPIFYLDQPSKDCGSRKPGNYCSIDHVSQYRSSLDHHYASGVYRRAMYLLATSPGWDVKKAFSIMVQANRFYWTSKTNFTTGLCGLLKATRDYQYDEAAVVNAFSQVGVTAENC